MREHRTIIFIGGLLVALTAALPAPCLASSLLSGYGGPGQGNQAILGSALVNGPRSGGGGGSGGASGSSSAKGGAGTASTTATGTGSSATGASGGSGTSAGGKSGARAGHTRGSAHKDSQEATGGAPASTASFYPASERIVVGERSGTLGLSGADLVYIFLAIGTLVFIGVFTRRLTRTSAAGSRRELKG